MHVFSDVLISDRIFFHFLATTYIINRILNAYKSGFKDLHKIPIRVMAKKYATSGEIKTGLHSKCFKNKKRLFFLEKY